jgi:hypothetical protein
MLDVGCWLLDVFSLKGNVQPRFQPWVGLEEGQSPKGRKKELGFLTTDGLSAASRNQRASGNFNASEGRRGSGTPR